MLKSGPKAPEMVQKGGLKTVFEAMADIQPIFRCLSISSTYPGAYNRPQPEANLYEPRDNIHEPGGNLYELVKFSDSRTLFTVCVSVCCVCVCLCGCV